MNNFISAGFQEPLTQSWFLESLGKSLVGWWRKRANHFELITYSYRRKLACPASEEAGRLPIIHQASRLEWPWSPEVLCVMCSTMLASGIHPQTPMVQWVGCFRRSAHRSFLLPRSRFHHARTPTTCPATSIRQIRRSRWWVISSIPLAFFIEALTSGGIRKHATLLLLILWVIVWGRHKSDQFNDGQFTANVHGSGGL